MEICSNIWCSKYFEKLRSWLNKGQCKSMSKVFFSPQNIVEFEEFYQWYCSMVKLTGFSSRNNFSSCKQYFRKYRSRSPKGQGQNLLIQSAGQIWDFGDPTAFYLMLTIPRKENVKVKWKVKVKLWMSESADLCNVGILMKNINIIPAVVSNTVKYKTVTPKCCFSWWWWQYLGYNTAFFVVKGKKKHSLTYYKMFYNLFRYIFYWIFTFKLSWDNI